MKRILLNLTLNTRDICGYSSIEGKTIQENRFIRSDALRYLSENDKDYLLSHHITTQLDLRTDEIAKRYPSILENDSRFSYIRIPVHEGSLSSLTNNKDIPSLYMEMVDNHRTFYHIFKVFATAPQGIIYCCTAGKDRTGIVTFLLLSIAKIDLQTIKKDYIMSSEFIEKNLPLVRKKVPTFPKFLGYSKEEYFDEFYDRFIRKYGDPISYLKLVGITEDDIHVIQKKLFEEDLCHNL